MAEVYHDSPPLVHAGSIRVLEMPWGGGQFLLLKTPPQRRMMLDMKESIASTPSRERRRSLDRLRSRADHAQTALAADSTDDLPEWFPASGLAPNVRRAVVDTIAPAYRRFVTEASGEMERTVGASMVYLIWIELVNQVRLANALADRDSADAILYDPERLTDRYLELIGAKCQAAELMLKIRMANVALDRLATAPSRDEPVPQIEAAPIPLFPPLDPQSHTATDPVDPSVCAQSSSQAGASRHGDCPEFRGNDGCPVAADAASPQKWNCPLPSQEPEIVN